MGFAIKPLRQPLRAAKDKRLILIAGITPLFLTALFYPGKAPAPPELNRQHPLDWASLKQHWAQGEMIVLVRHLERCDHSDAPCLTGSTGITRPPAMLSEPPTA